MFINIFQNYRSGLPQTSTVSLNKNKSNSLGAFFIEIFNIFSITVYTHATTFWCTSYPVFCFELLWPDDTKWHALSLSSCVLLKACCLMGTKPLPEQIHATSNEWLVTSKLSKIWSSWRSTFCDVITTCKYLSVHSAPDVLITSSQLQSCSRGPVVFIWCQSPGHSLCKRIHSLSWAYMERKSQSDHIYTTNESSLVPYILKMRGQAHNCPFESIWFAISQPLCIMYMSNIYSYFYAN